MNQHDARIRPDALLPLATGSWLGYLLLLTLIDLTLFPRPVYPTLYYVTNGAVGLLALVVALAATRRPNLAHRALPLLILALAVAPVVTSNLAVRPLAPERVTSPEYTILRQMPLLLVGLILTAYRYGWRWVILYSVAISGLWLALYATLRGPREPSLLPPATALLTQAVSFLVIGYLIAVLIDRLQAGQRALQRANARLVDHAATLEDLTISRERNRLARELHDTLAHTLSGLSVQLETTKAYLAVEPDTAATMLDTALTATRSGLAETRRALTALRATPLEDLGLVLAMEELARESARRAGLACHVTLPESLPALPTAVEQCLYRVAQEALSNVIYHAQARELRLTLTLDGGVSLTVADDGLGFDPQADLPGHYGLAGMRERAALVGGTLRIDSAPGNGTQVTLRIEREQLQGVGAG